MSIDDDTLCVPTIDGKVHIIPVCVFTNVIFGERKVTDIADWEIIVRTIFKEWLQRLRQKGREK